MPGAEEIALPEGWADDDIPRGIDALIADAEDAAWALEEGDESGRFVAGDYRSVWQVLCRWMREGEVARGAEFLEWGSGQGMATVLASLLGLKATGVECNERLVAAARALAERHGAERARFVHGTYAPLAGSRLPVVDARGRDVVYVYPWPGEEEFFLRHFAATAKTGSRLLMWLGALEMRAFRKA